MSKRLKDLCKVLDLTEKELKGIMSSNRKDNEIITLNMANACRALAQFTGYKDLESCKKMIRGQINLLYLSNKKYADFFKTNIMPHYNNKALVLILEQAHSALEHGDFTTFNKVLRSNKHLKKYCKKTAKKINLKLLDRLRDTNKAKSSDAKGILNSVNKGKKILTTEKAISEAVDKRAKRYGAVGSLFWRSAKELNPKIRSDGRISKDKMKKHKLTNGMTFKGKYENSTIDVKIRHKAGDNNSKFDSELTKRIDKQVTYWLDRAYKQIATKRYLGKHLDKI